MHALSRMGLSHHPLGMKGLQVHESETWEGFIAMSVPLSPPLFKTCPPMYLCLAFLTWLIKPCGSLKQIFMWIYLRYYVVSGLYTIWRHFCWLKERFACSSSFAIYSIWIMLEYFKVFHIIWGVKSTPKSKFEATTNYVVHCVLGTTI